MDLLLITDGNKLHNVYIKDFNNLYAVRQNTRIKNVFADIIL